MTTIPIYRLVYVSTAAPGLTDSDIADILDVSVSNNDERYLTGFLVHNGVQFMQALEGARDEVSDIYQRILQDQRHTGIIQIIGEAVSRRAFPDWAMNYHRVDERSSGGMVIRNDDRIDALLPEAMPRELLHLFSRFLKIDPIAT